MRFYLITGLLLFPILGAAQKKITLEDIFQKAAFKSETVAALFDEPVQQKIDFGNIKKNNGQPLGRPDEIITCPNRPSLYLLKMNKEPVYRRSAKFDIYLYDASAKKLEPVTDKKVLHPQFSPTGDKLSFVQENNLYLYDIATGKITAITRDGKWNYIINGNCDWVYEEEFEFSQAYQWSPGGRYLAYYRFDESRVKEYSFTRYNNDYNEQYAYKYPKAGEENSKIEIHIFDVNTGADVKADFEQGDIYIPRIRWTTREDALVVFWMNRYQNHLKLLRTNAATGSSGVLYEETNKYYIEINDDWKFLKDGKSFLFTSESNGYRNLYLGSLDGKTKTAITRGKYDITDINGVDEDNRMVYYTAAWPTPMDRTAFVTDFDGRTTTVLTKEQGHHKVVFDRTFTRFYDYYSTLNKPQQVSIKLVTGSGNNIKVETEKVLTDNNKLQTLAKDYHFGKFELIQVPNGRGEMINGVMLKPANFNPSKKYPVLFCNYGGPGSQEVVNSYLSHGSRSLWYQFLAQKGFIVVSFDNTGTGFRGEAFKKKTYLELGKYEIEDQVAAAKWMQRLPYVDKKNIGHWGWSYGGFMSALAITKGANVFSAAVAVAPVTNWRFYDNIYTERYMRTPRENAKGYDNNSPINFTDKISGKFLIIHGTADDNVHFQNATQMVTAMIKNDIPFESAYYPNKNHGISGAADNTTIHLWKQMSNWIIKNLGNSETDQTEIK